MQNSYVRRLHGLCYLIAERLKLLRSFFHSRLWPKTRLFRPKNKNTESTYVFFGRKIKCRKIKKSPFLVPKTKTKFGRPSQGTYNYLKGLPRCSWERKEKGGNDRKVREMDVDLGYSPLKLESYTR